METKVLRSAIEMYPIIFLILIDDSTLISHKARMFVYSNAHLLLTWLALNTVARYDNITTVIVRITKTNTKSLTVGKKWARNLIEYFPIQNRCFLHFWSWCCRRFRTKRRNKFTCSKFPPRCPPSCLLWFSREQNAPSTFDIFAERNVWLQSALRSFAIVCDYMETALFAIVCDHMETSLYPVRARLHS